MKFIFPKNYDIKTKVLGTFDFHSLLFSCIFIFITFSICSFFKINISTTISIIIIINLPLFLFLNFGIGKENIIYIIYYLMKYLISSKIYIFNKE